MHFSEVKAEPLLETNLPATNLAFIHTKNEKANTFVNNDSRVDKLHDLSLLEKTLPIQDSTRCQTVICKLEMQIVSESNFDLIEKMIQILTSLSVQPNVSGLRSIDFFLSIIKYWLSSNFVHVIKLFPIVLYRINYILKIKKIMPNKIIMSMILNYQELSEIKELIFSLIYDSDSRIRVLGYKLFQDQILKYNSFSFSTIFGENDKKVYEDISSFSDESEYVRIEAMRLTWLISNIENKKWIINNTFTKLCKMVSDPNRAVRAEACSLLGWLKGVSSNLMCQSLSKKLLKAADINIHNDPFDPSLVSTDQTDIVKVGQNPIVDNAANGAFVHGLEDEFYEVRNATISSVCQLSHQNVKFAEMTTEFFVDSFNDEIDAVRINSIRSLSKVGHMVSISEKQITIILALLDDKSSHIRFSAHQILQSIKFPSILSFKKAVLSLLDNMINHVLDQITTLRTLAKIGHNHSYIVHFVTEELLDINPHVVSPEPNLDQIKIVGIEILIFNAISRNPSILSLLPPYIKKHYLYVKKHFNSYVPDIEYLVQFNRVEEKVQINFAQLIEEFCQLKLPNFDKSFTSTFETFANDERKNYYCLAQFYKKYSQVWLNYCWIREGVTSYVFSLNIIKNTYELEYSYLGLCDSVLNHLQILRNFAYLVLLKIQQHLLKSKTNASNYAFLSNYSEFYEPNDLNSCKILSLDCLLENINTLKNDYFTDLPKRLNKFQLSDIINYYPIDQPLKIDQNIKKQIVHITSPASNNQNEFLSFMSNYPKELGVTIAFEYVSNTDHLKLYIEYPDQSYSLHEISGKLKTLAPYKYELAFKIVLFQKKWNQADCVELKVVKVVPEPVLLSNQFFKSKTEEGSSVLKECHKKFKKLKNSFVFLVPLSEPLKYWIHPR